MNLFHHRRYILSFLFFIAAITFASAQNATMPATAQNEDVLRSNGMIYVVIGVIVIILSGLILFLTTLDKKLRKLEKEIKDK